MKKEFSKAGKCKADEIIFLFRFPPVVTKAYGKFCGGNILLAYFSPRKSEQQLFSKNFSQCICKLGFALIYMLLHIIALASQNFPFMKLFRRRPHISLIMSWMERTNETKTSLPSLALHIDKKNEWTSLASMQSCKL